MLHEAQVKNETQNYCFVFEIIDIVNLTKMDAKISETCYLLSQ